MNDVMPGRVRLVSPHYSKHGHNNEAFRIGVLDESIDTAHRASRFREYSDAELFDGGGLISERWRRE